MKNSGKISSSNSTSSNPQTIGGVEKDAAGELRVRLICMNARSLLTMQRKINQDFKRRRDRGGIVSGTYKKLQAVEGELSRRRIFW